jgi:CheY-like chemotaxis protein
MDSLAAERGRVLVVDDVPINVVWLAQVLSRDGQYRDDRRIVKRG